MAYEQSITLPSGLMITMTENGFLAYADNPSFEVEIVKNERGLWVYPNGSTPQIATAIRYVDRQYQRLKHEHEQNEARKASELQAKQDMLNAAWQEIIDVYGGDEA